MRDGGASVRIGCLVGFIVSGLVSILAGCGEQGSANGGEDPARSFLEAPPSEQVLTAATAALVDELEQQVDPTIRTAIESFVQSYPYIESSAPHTAEPAGPADLFQMAGVAAIFKGGASTGLWCFARAAQAAPDQAAPLSQIGFALNALDRPAEAKSFLLAAHAREEGLHSPLVNLSHSYQALGQLERAAYYLSRAVQLQPQNVRYKVKLAELYREANQPVLTMSLLGQALVLAPDDEEIKALAEAAGVPGAGAMSAPSIGQRALAESEPGLLAQIGAIKDRLSEDLLATVAEAISAEKNLALATRQTDQMLNLSTVIGCNSACPDDICRSQCALALCAAEHASHETFKNALLPLPPRHEAAIMSFLVQFQEEAYTLYFKHEKSSAYSDSSKQSALSLIHYEVASAQITILLDYESIKSVIAIDAGIVEQTCNAAEESYGTAYINSLFATQNSGLSFDLCLDGVICFGLDNSVLSISGGQLVTGEMSLDLKSGEFAVGVGLGFTDPSGTLQAGVSVKLNSNRGIGVGADVKVGGPLKLKLGRDFYLLEN